MGKGDLYKVRFLRRAPDLSKGVRCLDGGRFESNLMPFLIYSTVTPLSYYMYIMSFTFPWANLFTKRCTKLTRRGYTSKPATTRGAINKAKHDA